MQLKLLSFSKKIKEVFLQACEGNIRRNNFQFGF